MDFKNVSLEQVVSFYCIICLWLIINITKGEERGMKVAKRVKLFMLCACMAALGILTSAVAVFAESAGGTANSAVVSAMTSAAADMTATGTSLIPIALGVVTLILVVVFGIRFFKRIVNK